MEDRRRHDLGLVSPTTPSLNLVYYGIGQPQHLESRRSVPGDNKWSHDHLVARDADTGMAKWVYQMTPARRVGL